MESINGSLSDRQRFRKTLQPGMRRASANPYPVRFSWLSILMLFIFLLIPACDSQQEADTTRGVSTAEEPVFVRRSDD